MIEGAVHDPFEAVVPLPLHGPHGRHPSRNRHRLHRHLHVATAVIADIGFAFSNMGWAFLANDDVLSFDGHDMLVL